MSQLRHRTVVPGHGLTPLGSSSSHHNAARLVSASIGRLHLASSVAGWHHVPSRPNKVVELNLRFEVGNASPSDLKR